VPLHWAHTRAHRARRQRSPGSNLPSSASRSRNRRSSFARAGTAHTSLRVSREGSALRRHGRRRSPVGAHKPDIARPADIPHESLTARRTEQHPSVSFRLLRRPSTSSSRRTTTRSQLGAAAPRHTERPRRPGTRLPLPTRAPATTHAWPPEAKNSSTCPSGTPVGSPASVAARASWRQRSQSRNARISRTRDRPSRPRPDAPTPETRPPRLAVRDPAPRGGPASPREQGRHGRV
jgi:hypothetical protein